MISRYSGGGCDGEILFGLSPGLDNDNIHIMDLKTGNVTIIDADLENVNVDEEDIDYFRFRGAAVDPNNDDIYVRLGMFLIICVHLYPLLNS